MAQESDPPRPPEAPTERSKRRPRPRLRAPQLSPAVADWASLFGDLARPVPTPSPSPVDWRVHDRTHIEFAIDYPIGSAQNELVWEAYFFIPESFRLRPDSYDKKAIYDDLWSYVRYAVPTSPFGALARADGPLALVRGALDRCRGHADGSPESAEAMRQLRVFACLVRASGVAAMRQLERRLGSPPRDPDDEADLDRGIGAFAAEVADVPRAFRDAVNAAELPDAVETAARWADEDISILLESLSGSLGVALEGKSGPGARQLAALLADRAVAEARHRQRQGYDSVGRADADERSIEHLEFRRHVLKRFTSSVLWLTLKVHTGAAWIVHALYAVAAAVAMTFALFASFPTASAATENLSRYALLVVIAYAIKDRLKAILQNAFSAWVSARFPDRKWIIRDHERGLDVGRVLERAGFIPFRSVPDAVLHARRMTREHALEESARPERVLWHQKIVHVAPRSGPTEGTVFPMLTEIFRLNLHSWLAHTDDPNRKIVFADPDDAHVYSAVARRVYNLNAVYRLRSAQGPEGPWRRIRVVVSRKGIERIDPIC